MKLLLTTFCAALFISPLAFAESKKCDKKCDKEKEAKEGTIIAHCGKCKKDGEHKDGEKKEEAKKEGTLADCKKCDKDKKKEEEKKEGTLA
jgi:hypothetical protein